MLAATLILLTAVLLDAAIGDPAYPLHPVRLMGKTISTTEAILRGIRLSGFLGGALLLTSLLALFGGGTYLLLTETNKTSWVLEAVFAAFLLYSSIALTDMFNHAYPVAQSLQQQDLTLAREEVQKIVARDANLLNEKGVARAAVESVAEGFVDGFLSPLFWFSGGAALTALTGLDPVAGGITAAISFRVTNTLDSMVGYRNERYEHFGTASARFDDILNFLPARLAIPILSMGAFLTGMDAEACWRTGLRDRLKHASPNSGHAESCVAGALGIRLGGPTTYPHGTVDKPWLGDQSGTIDAESIERCCKLIRAGGWISLLLFLAALQAVHFAGF
ncbi:MAG: cobalamin biosynthesis protein CobD [Deltaproteobacteria bacterium]|nr:cobalamin biosynthesis protein CobD [Deltaproteobacteria bacterium]